MVKTISKLTISLGFIGLVASKRVLIYTATAGYRHDCIPVAIETLQSFATNDLSFDFTEDKTKFTIDNLSNYDALLFMMNSDEILDSNGQSAFQQYIQKGGNYIGIHSASAALFDDPFYGTTVGAFFDYHPALQNATILVEDTTHPSTSMLPTRWEVTDEMYNFRSDPRAIGAKLLLSVDESSYVDNGTRNYNQGTPHPIGWYQDLSTGGRSWYSSLGHLNETWRTSLFQQHILGGIQWTLNILATNATTSTASSPSSASSTSSSSSSSSTSSTASSTTSSASLTLHGHFYAIFVFLLFVYVSYL